MTDESDLMKLYSKRILALAADLTLTTRLAEPDASARLRSPLCGSTVTVDLSVAGGRIAGFGQDVKACALGQAAASVIARNVIGRSRDEILLARNQLSSMLSDRGPIPDPPFEALAALLPARDYKNRHASIMLSIEATLKAMEDALDPDAKTPCKSGAMSSVQTS